AGYKPLRQVKSRVGKCAAQRTGDENYRDRQGERVLAGGHVVRCGSDRHRLPWRRDSSAAARGIDLENGKLVIRREIAQNRKRREPRLMALAQWGLRHLLERAHALGASEPQHYLLPLQRMQSRYYHKGQDAKWDVNRPMFSWTRSWRKLVMESGMPGFRFHDLCSAKTPYNGEKLGFGEQNLATVVNWQWQRFGCHD